MRTELHPKVVKRKRDLPSESINLDNLIPKSSIETSLVLREFIGLIQKLSGDEIPAELLINHFREFVGIEQDVMPFEDKLDVAIPLHSALLVKIYNKRIPSQLKDLWREISAWLIEFQYRADELNSLDARVRYHDALLVTKVYDPAYSNALTAQKVSEDIKPHFEELSRAVFSEGDYGHLRTSRRLSALATLSWIVLMMNKTHTSLLFMAKSELMPGQNFIISFCNKLAKELVKISQEDNPVDLENPYFLYNLVQCMDNLAGLGIGKMINRKHLQSTADHVKRLAQLSGRPYTDFLEGTEYRSALESVFDGNEEYLLMEA